MQKIIAVLDGLRLSESTIQYAVSLAKQEQAHLVGVFLDDFLYNSYSVYEVVYKENTSHKEVELLENNDRHQRDASVASFRKTCEASGIHFTVHRDKNIAIQDLVHESIYADLMIIDKTESFSSAAEPVPTRFISELLAQAQCPVLVVPPKHKTVDKVVILYDGSPSAVFATRMFCYVLPALCTGTVEVVCVKNNDESLHIPDHTLMKELMKRHFPKAEYTVLKGFAELEIVARLHAEQEQVLVVLGAYRRSGISRWLRPSLADMLMQKLNLPLFIAHHK